MPIKGLTDNPRLPRLGSIRIGETVTSEKTGKEHPHAVDHFVVPEAVAAVYGANPKSLDVMFPSDSLDDIAPQWFTAFTQSRSMVCRGDGVNANRLIDATKQSHEEGTGVVTGPIAGPKATEVEWVQGITCPGEECGYYQDGTCRMLMRLLFVLPRVPGLGVWQFATSSRNSILNVNGSIRLIESVFGRVRGIPLTLSVVPMEVAPEGRKKTVYVIKLESDQTLAQLRPANHAGIGLLPEPPDDAERPTELYPNTEVVEADADPAPASNAEQAAADGPPTPRPLAEGGDPFDDRDPTPMAEDEAPERRTFQNAGKLMETLRLEDRIDTKFVMEALHGCEQFADLRAIAGIPKDALTDAYEIVKAAVGAYKEE